MTDDNDKNSRKRRRTLGSFPCPDCDKVFTRSDHLARHHLNHDPKEVFECDFVVSHFGGEKRKCGKQFVRKDLRDRHMKRHYEPDPNVPEGVEGVLPEARRFKEHPKLPPMNQSSSASRSSVTSFPPDSTYNSVIPASQASEYNKEAEKQLNGSAPIFTASAPSNSSPVSINSTNLNPNLNGMQTFERSNSLQETPGTQPQAFGTWPELPQTNPHQPPNGMQYPYGNINVPYSQSDILSWLFTDSPPNNALAPNKGSPKQPPPQKNEMFTTPIVPSPLGGSQVSPYAENLMNQNINLNNNGQNFAPNDSSYNYNDPYRNYGFQDTNIFSTSENPLDEIFWANYPGRLDEVTQRARMSSATSSSPSNTADSAISPESSSSNNSKLGSKSFPFIEEHAAKCNVAGKKHLFIDGLILDLLLKCIPSIDREKLEKILQPSPTPFSIEDQLSFYLSLYWLIFHPQFSILHKPSFDTKTCQPPLLWAMIVLGSNYSHLSDFYANDKKSPERILGDTIIPPLRYVIFEHDDFKTPVRIWILQSLNLIEWCEKNFLLRRMHERGHIHHGTNVQLLRRSPLLGGNPATSNKAPPTSGSASSAGEEDSESERAMNGSGGADDTSDRDLFFKWLDSESLKRITFMTFYLDIMDYVKFRHNPQISFYQVQLLNIPCDDENLWESYDVNGSFHKILKRQKKLQHQRSQLLKKELSLFRIKSGDSFLSVLKKLLKSDDLKTWQMTKLSIFNKKLIFAGLVSLMYQMQQAGLQNSWSLLASNDSKAIQSANKSMLQQWKVTLSRAFAKWNVVLNGSCCQPVIKPPSKLFSAMSTTQCKYALYHLTQIIGMSDINHYDIAIFGGSPTNQSVDTTLKDQYIVQTKLKKMWQKNRGTLSDNELMNLKGVMHCYILFWEMMLSPSGYDFLHWSATLDYFDGMYAIAIATLVLWSYVYSICGVESQAYNTELDGIHTYDSLAKMSKEGGYEYLKRIRSAFDGKILAQTDSTGHLIGDIEKCCYTLQLIPRKNNISGLCFLVGTRLLESQWDVIRENAQLIIHCGLRSVGKKEATCSSLFQSELKE